VKVLAIANQKGGVGKTTTAVNLSACIALAGHRCLLVDVDAQGNATSGLGQARLNAGGAHELFFTPDRARSAIRETDIPLLHLVPASRQLAAADRELGRSPDAATRLAKALKRLDVPYDYVLIDCPPSLGLVPMNALAAADGVIIPIQCEYYAMEGLAQMLELFRQVQQQSNPTLRIAGILFTMYERGLEYADEVAAEIRQHCGPQVYKCAIPRDMLLSEAPSHGKPIIDYAPRSLGAWSYIELAKEVLSDEEQPSR
jgi:chromosome partitioning protein